MLDANGGVHPYRTTIGQDAVPEPLPIGTIVAGAYRRGCAWQPTMVRGLRATLPLVDRTVLPREAATRVHTLANRIAPDVATFVGAWSDAERLARDILRQLDDAPARAKPATRMPAPAAFSPPRQLVAVVTPQHRYPLTANQQISLRHLRTYLSEFDRYLIGPCGPPPEFSDFKTRAFPPRDFASIATYSRLLVSERFYRAFEDYEYILIYQFDALVFSGDLERWCHMGWDYVGSPWRDPGAHAPARYAL